MSENNNGNNKSTYVAIRKYKVMVGDCYEVWKNKEKGNIYHKILVKKKMQDGTSKYFYKTIRFKNGVDIPDRTKIRILNFFEDVAPNKKDKWNPYWFLFITNFEIVDEELDKQIHEQVNMIENTTPIEELEEKISEEYEDNITDEEVKIEEKSTNDKITLEELEDFSNF